MAQPFIVAPYKPNEWEKADVDLVINPTIYKEALENRWPTIIFYDADPGTLLSWGLVGSGATRIHGALQDNHQIVWLEFLLEEFFLWHRSIIPAKYSLFLFKTSSWNSLELTPGTTLEDIRGFYGKEI